MARLGVVLGGGGARGLAHVGVLRALADVDLEPDVVVGVSMGAVVGATYAARGDWYDALRAFDRSGLPGHEPLRGREGVDFLRAVLRSAVQIAPKAYSFFGPTGGYQAFGTQAMEDLLGGTPEFADLRLPFAATATDITSGRRAVLQEGSVAEAVIASAALPVLTRPVASGGRSFMDGGFIDPAPVDVARSLGADFVLVVHVGSPTTAEYTGDHLVDSPLGGVLRGLELGVQAFVESRLSAADMLVAPAFPDGLSWMAFNRADEIADIGHTAMRAVVPELADMLGR